MAKIDFKRRRELVAQIVQDYPVLIPNNRNSHIDWVSAFKAHPEWKKELRWNDRVQQMRVYALANHIRKKELKKERVQQHPANVAALEGKPASNGETDLLRKLVTDYTTNKNTQFVLAFREHPEWVEPLHWNDHKSRNRLYARAKTLRRQIRKETLAAKRAAKAEALQRTEQNHDQEQEQAQSYLQHCPQCGFMVAAWTKAIGGRFHFCPHCGFNLKILSAAFTVALRHSHTDESTQP